MNRQEEATNTLDLLKKVHPLAVAAQPDMLRARERHEIAQRELKLALIRAEAESQGKNETQRKADAYASPHVQRLREAADNAEAEFSAAYVLHKEHETTNDYIKQVIALLGVISD